MSTNSPTAGGAAFNAGIKILQTIKRWYCPECGRQHVTNIPQPHSPMHQCASLKGAWVPFVEEGIKASLRVNEREDYIGTDIGQTDDDGKIIRSITTIREDGEDCHILAPTVIKKIET